MNPLITQLRWFDSVEYPFSLLREAADELERQDKEIARLSCDPDDTLSDHPGCAYCMGAGTPIQPGQVCPRCGDRLPTRRQAAADKRIRELEAALNSPEVLDFLEGVKRETAHQRQRWSVDHDGGKEPEDWFWLLGYLAGKALASARAGNQEKALHHTISSAAALANWHAAMLGRTTMRPGVDPSKLGLPGVAGPRGTDCPGPGPQGCQHKWVAEAIDQGHYGITQCSICGAIDK